MQESNYSQNELMKAISEHGQPTPVGWHYAKLRLDMVVEKQICK